MPSINFRQLHPLFMHLPAFLPAKCVLLFLIMLFADHPASGQRTKQKFITDNNRRFEFAETGGVTASYISAFGDSLNIPELRLLDNSILTNDQLKGKTVIINFWFTACKPCIAEMPSLNKAFEKHISDSTAFIAITFDTEQKIKDFLNRHTFLFRIALSTLDQIAQIKHVSLYPLTAVINKFGKVSFVAFGLPVSAIEKGDFFNLLDREIAKAKNL